MVTSFPVCHIPVAEKCTSVQVLEYIKARKIQNGMRQMDIVSRLKKRCRIGLSNGNTTSA
jgi:hypothetical protein